ncbi:PhoH family protein [Campylobacter corcagiensis]|uniref:PhoH family protein n=1 Tax=Campylobacter corcagiensis TaxID=1448857 RepID=A0A7M1LH60_9BACT|nr:PhoH family protein [Campylobacter corcagiensis]QKF64668.1 putative ribonuclease, YlaK/PhoH family [Campylobacter corcagiensis]QOQ87166.1 PhoH family protein [Campylobacter corcagiensis]
MTRKVYIVDTNIILANVLNIVKLSQNLQNIVAIPEVVLFELEDKKRDSGELGYQAREFARMIANCEDLGIKIYKDKSSKEPNLKAVKLKFENSAEIWLVTSQKYDKDTLEYSNLKEFNDKLIVSTASKLEKTLSKRHYDVKFISLDIYARMFAKFKNLSVESLRDDRDETPKLKFHTTIEVDDVDSIDERYYHEFITSNFDPALRCVTFRDKFSKEKYALVEGGILNFIQSDDFRSLIVKPVNTKQKFLAKALLSPYFDAYVVDAKAGTGKTLMAISCAMRLIDSYDGESEYEKIIYVRNSIESIDRGAEVGFLSGNDEKFRIYNMALFDTLDFIARRKLKKEQTNADEVRVKVDELIKKYSIEMLWPGEARGRTLSKAIVILDEWQNSSNKTTQLILSRLNNSCKVIIIGSNKQIDNLYLNRYNNGLTTMLKLSNLKPKQLNIFATDLEASVRGKFSEFADEVF